MATIVAAILIPLVLGLTMPAMAQTGTGSRESRPGTPSKALNPQPEVPSKQTDPKKPKALNPQPEVPSKPMLSERRDPKNPKALNPQPEVPSKPKAKKKGPKPPKSTE
jgi:hypothetical protein